MDAAAFAWIDGRVRLRAEVGVPVDDSAYAEGRGCYSTARIAGGAARFAGLLRACSAGIQWLIPLQ